MLSVIMPGIRMDGWVKMYNSIAESYSGEWELIIISPYNIHNELKDKGNVRWIESWASPTVGMQLGLIEARGEWVTFTWDDAEFFKHSLDDAFKVLEANGMDYKVAVSGKYIEGTTTPENYRLMASNEYYRLNYHQAAKSEYFPDHFLLFNTGVVSKRLLMKIGGFDCRFEAIAMAFADLAARMQFNGAKVILSDDIIIKCKWLNGEEGDHAPMHNAMYDHDIVLYEIKYSNPSCISLSVIDTDNWKNEPARWERRWKKEVDLTVLVPGIRVDNWARLYYSISQSFSGTWEIVFISPYDLPSSMNHENVQYINDWGTPIKCQQRGLVAARGRYVTWAADDGVFLPQSLDIGFGLIDKSDYKMVVTGKYFEGPQRDDHMAQEWYYILSNHNATDYVPKGYYMLNVGLVSRKLLFEVGGWDCRFEVCPMAYNDLAIRLQNYGSKFVLQNEMMFKCGFLPGEEGDHGPIHHAQIDHDIPEMQKLYGGINPKDRVMIDLDNWTQCSDKWERRFMSNGSK